MPRGPLGSELLENSRQEAVEGQEVGPRSPCKGTGFGVTGSVVTVSWP